MRQVPLQYISKSLHAKFDHISEKPLPKRWVELIHYLNEIEQQKTQMLRQTPKGNVMSADNEK